MVRCLLPLPGSSTLTSRRDDKPKGVLAVVRHAMDLGRRYAGLLLLGSLGAGILLSYLVGI